MPYRIKSNVKLSMVFSTWKHTMLLCNPHNQSLSSLTLLYPPIADWGDEVVDAGRPSSSNATKADPTGCAFYANAPATIARKLGALQQKVLIQPVPAYSPNFPKYSFVDYPTLKNAVLASFHQPYDTFSTLAQGFLCINHPFRSGARQFWLLPVETVPRSLTNCRSIPTVSIKSRAFRALWNSGPLLVGHVCPSLNQFEVNN